MSFAGRQAASRYTSRSSRPAANSRACIRCNSPGFPVIDLLPHTYVWADHQPATPSQAGGVAGARGPGTA